MGVQVVDTAEAQVVGAAEAQVVGRSWSAGGRGVNSRAEGSDFSDLPSSCVALIKAKH